MGKMEKTAHPTFTTTKITQKLAKKWLKSVYSAYFVVRFCFASLYT